MSELDWTNPDCPLGQHFKIRDALWLHSWSRLASSGDGLDANVEAALVNLFQIMDVVRNELGWPIIIHCAYRPGPYNAEIGGAKNSSHMARIEGGAKIAAVDWSPDIPGVDSVSQACDQAKAALLPKIAELGLRMENNGAGANWIHLDTHPVPSGGTRFFRP